ncbi:DNA cytosine methyltransferase [Acinetobacter sp. YH16037]|uniref:DNA cytosine methyltransferase n=1 Tax=Acinetobacter sp. YH16037 TaxID=2601182 RepID=UPI0015D23A7E|nr:DNA (cytosine-5-)-methyltransferase [Acinetobacter sp. YH16037]
MKVLSLFSGCGGMDLGLEGGFLAHKSSINSDIYASHVLDHDENYVHLKKTGFETVFANDILPFAKLAWCNFFKTRVNEPENIFHLESIVDVVNNIENKEFSFPNDIDVVTGGFPCQDFSFAGKRKGFESHKDHNGVVYNEPTEATRGQLYLWLKKVVEMTKPKVFIAENVKGLVTLGDVKEIIQNDFRNIDDGYVVLDAKVLNAKDYGVAQNRERVIFIGISKRHANQQVLESLMMLQDKSEVYPYPPKTHGLEDGLKPYATLNQILAHLPEPEFAESDKSQQAYSKAKLFKKTQGNIEVNMNGQAPTIRAEHHGNIEFRRLSQENGGSNLAEFHLPQRRLTVRECALIQSFPPDYEFVFHHGKYNSVSASSAYKIIGNAVPPLLGFAIGKHLSEIWPKLFK